MPIFSNGAITLKFKSTRIKIYRMKKIVFVDVVSLTFFLESWMLQQGADSSMVDGKFYFILFHISY